MGKRKLGVLMLTVVVIFLPFVSTGQEDDNGLYWWIDEAGVMVPAVQDHFVLGADSWRNEDPFHIIVIGDSIAWGCGLDTSEKYSYLVADCLQKKLEMPVDVTVLAHTGATLEKPTNINKDNHNFLDPELSSWDPTIMEQVDEIRNPEHVDLILVSGGINDVGVDEILNPFTDSYDIFTGCADIEDPMYNILIELLTKCYNAKIIVTSYYPIASNDTPNTATNDFANLIKENDPNWLHRWVGSAFLSRNSIIEKSNTFDSNSRGSIGRAVDRANLYSRSHFNAERVSFALVNFPPERSYGTSTSWLWRLIDTKNGGKTDDHRYDYRTSLCDGTYNLFCNWDDKIAAIGHPNVEGAKEYNRSIIEKISDTWPDWLHSTVLAFDVSPLGVTSGESFVIDYTVSDNCGSGLTQVELWRKNETSDWQEIKRNTLAGENGPLSGSFTDSPPAPGTYWYGVHVVDNAGNWNDERNSNTNYQPVSFEPVEVEVTPAAEPSSLDQTIVLDYQPISSEPVEVEMKAYATADISSQAPSEEWNKTFGGQGYDCANSVQITPDGGYIIAGYTDGFRSWYDMMFSQNRDAWLIKTDSEGNVLWNRVFGGRGMDCANSVQITPDDGYIIAGYCYDYSGVEGGQYAWLIRTDNEGNEIWNRTLGVEDGIAYSVQPTSDGGYIISGKRKDFIGAGTYNLRTWLIKTDSLGNEVWTKEFSEISDKEANSVQLTLDGGYILASSKYSLDIKDYEAWLIKMDAYGNELWNKTFHVAKYSTANSVLPTPDGGYILAGKARPRGRGDLNALLIKTDTDGNELWNKTFGSWSYDSANSVQLTPDGGYTMVGETIGHYHKVLLIKTDTDGNELWNKTFGGESHDSAFSHQIAPDGGCIVAGNTFSFGAGYTDAWLIKVAPI